MRLGHAKTNRAIRFGAVALVAAVGFVVPGSAGAGLPLLRPAARPGGVWLAGDLHVHTQNGHDTCVTPLVKFDGTPCDEPWTWSFSPAERIELAKQRGLDFLAITDHNNIVSQSDPAWTSETDLITIPAYENSLPGHAQMLGATHCFGGTEVEVGITYCTNPDESVAGVIAERDALRAEGGAFQINHPGDTKWYARYGHDIVPDSVEVWNIGPSFWQPPAPAASDNDFATDFYDGFLDRGFKVAATGGSDSHWRLTSALQGIGQPTTWVFAPNRSRQAVLDAIRKGRTIISAQPPAYLGPRLYLEADKDGNGTFESMVGDSVPKGSRMRVRAELAPPGSKVRIVTSGSHRDVLLGPGGTFSFRTTSRWVRAELLLPDLQPFRQNRCDPIVGSETTYCRNRLLVLAMTSPIYQVTPAPPVPVTGA